MPTNPTRELRIACRKRFSDSTSSSSASSTDKVTAVPEKRNGGNNDSSVQFVNNSSSYHHSNSFMPINIAHRGQVESRVASGNLSTENHLEALVPLFVDIHFGAWIVDIHFLWTSKLECGLWTSIFCGHPCWSVDCGHPFFLNTRSFLWILESTDERLYKTCKTKKPKLYPFVLTC